MCLELAPAVNLRGFIVYGVGCLLKDLLGGSIGDLLYLL